MSRAHPRPKLNKRRIATHQGYDVCTVDAYAVRDLAQGDEEFTNFATHGDFRELIPETEIWIAGRLFEAEGLFYIANALARLKAQKDGASEERAYEAGQNVERALREKIVGVKYRAGRPHRRVPGRIYVERYTTLPDPKTPIEVWFVDGNLIRSFYKTDYTEGGHGYVYRWVPKREIWVEKDLEAAELPFIVAHEYLELRLMRDRGMDYDPAHEACARVEFDIRSGHPIKSLLAPEGRKVGKADLPKLAGDEFFSYVLKHYKLD